LSASGERKFLLALVFLVVVVILNLPLPAAMKVKFLGRQGVAPFQNLMSVVMFRASDGWQSIARSRDVIQESQALKQQIMELTLQIKDLEFKGEENDRLRELLEFRKSSPRTLLTARVLARGDGTGWWQTLTLDKGTDQGLRPHMAVINLDGLVGHVTENLGRTTADVRLISDPSVKISCRLPRPDALGIASGRGVALDGDAALSMLSTVRPFGIRYMEKRLDIIEGDAVETSGLGGLYPPGLAVGQVHRVETDPSGLFLNAEVVPAVDFSRLDYVFVVLK